MNNFDNVNLVYYGEDVYITENQEYHAMQEKIKKYLQYIVDTMLSHEFEKKSIEASEFIEDLKDAITNISSVKNYDGKVNKITVSDKYITFDYFKKIDNEELLKKVIIDKETNEFNFINNLGDTLVDITSYSISNEGIKKNVYNAVEPIFMLNDDTINESITDIKEDLQNRRIAV